MLCYSSVPNYQSPTDTEESPRMRQYCSSNQHNDTNSSSCAAKQMRRADRRTDRGRLLYWTQWRIQHFNRGSGVSMGGEHGGQCHHQNLGLPPGCPPFSYTWPIMCHILRGQLLHKSCKLTTVKLFLTYILCLCSPTFRLAPK